jgi:hypothetical protein
LRRQDFLKLKDLDGREGPGHDDLNFATEITHVGAPDVFRAGTPGLEGRV